MSRKTKECPAVIVRNVGSELTLRCVQISSASVMREVEPDQMAVQAGRVYSTVKSLHLIRIVYCILNVELINIIWRGSQTVIQERRPKTVLMKDSFMCGGGGGMPGEISFLGWDFLNSSQLRSLVLEY